MLQTRCRWGVENACLRTYVRTIDKFNAIDVNNVRSVDKKCQKIYIFGAAVALESGEKYVEYIWN